MTLDQLDFEKGGGLLPAIVQDADSGAVLMLAYMNREALDKTRATGRVTFFSRSRQALWEKGETSGHTLEMVDMEADCDGDTLLVTARPRGPTCHTGAVTCFGEPRSNDTAFLSVLENLIASRAQDAASSDPESSYTVRLLRAGTARMAQKVGEEGVETALAAVSADRDKLTEEAADLVYHLMVLLRSQGLGLGDVSQELQRRHQPGS